MRQRLRIGSYLSGMFSQLFQAVPDFSRQTGGVHVELVQFNGQQRKALTNVIMKFPGNPGAFLFLRFN